MKKKIIQTLLLLVFVSISFVAYLWNKPHKNIEKVETETVSAEAITQLFEQNEALANKKYLNKALTINGLVAEVSLNEINQHVILIRGQDDLSGVQCTLKEKSAAVKAGDRVKISGFCNGYTLVVILDDCKLLN